MVPVGKLRCSEKKGFQCQFVEHKSYVDCPGVTPLPSRWEGTSWQPANCRMFSEWQCICHYNCSPNMLSCCVTIKRSSHSVVKVWIVIWVVMLRTAVDGWWHFGGACCLHFQGWSEVGSSSFLCSISNHSRQCYVEEVGGAPEVAYSITNICLWNLCTYFQTLLDWNLHCCFSCWYRSCFWFLVLCSVFEFKQCQHQVWSRPSQIRRGSG